MRAGMKIDQIYSYANQLGRMPASSIPVGLLCLFCILWLSIAPLFFATRCGLFLPHDHLLLGGANESDLESHLAAEAACATGAAPDAPPAPGHSHIGGGMIVSVAHFEPSEPGSTAPGSIFNLDQLALPALPADCDRLALLVWRLLPSRLAERLYFLPPWDPPPEASTRTG